MRVVVLGAGFGGLELTTRLSEELGDEVEVVLIDQAEAFVLGFSKLDVMFGRTVPKAVRHPYRDIVKPGVRFVQTAVSSIDPTARRVRTEAGSWEADILVVALGADLDPAATPGLIQGGHEFYTLAGAFAARDVLAGFGGGRVIIGVTSTPFKCPPAPSETALMMHDYLTERGLVEGSEVSLVMPFGVPVPPSPAASAALLAAFAERGITWHADRSVRALDPARKVAVLDNQEELRYDLFLGVPVHRAPPVVLESELCVDGWIPVNPLTLETTFPNVYAVGDVTSVGTPKAGVFAEGQAVVVADEIVAQHRGRQASGTYDGRGICYVEFGHHQVGRVDVTFRSGERPSGEFDGPSPDYAADKSKFGSSRIQRWFARDWTSY
jgi:sulfide:quinone oxidoreductase